MASDAGTVGGGPGGPQVPPPQYLADQLTLFQPREDRLSPRITSRSPQFFSPSGITAMGKVISVSYFISYYFDNKDGSGSR